MNKKLMLLSALVLTGVTTAAAQQRVTGQVVDSNGMPLESATVRVPGTKIITLTDAQGKFTLQGVPSGTRHLTVTYIGMQSATVNVAGNVKVVLKDNELAEAVVVGYGTAKKLGTVVGSVKKVTSDVIEGKPNVNVADALQGQVAGMDVANMSGEAGSLNNVSITIRGNGSIGASSAPLIVIDGSPSGAAMFSLLSSNDIESITTLKDASATSIYGSRAANGVIYITTKKGRKNEKAVVTVSQKLGWSQLARSIGNPMSSNELLDFQLANGIIYGDQYETYKAYGANTDWQDYLFDEAAPMKTTDVSVRGGSESTNYFVSTSYLDQEGVADYSGLERYTLRTNIDTKVNEWLNIGINQSVAYTERMTNGYTRNGSNNSYSYSTAPTAFAPYWDPYHPSVAQTHQFYNSTTYDNRWLLSVQPSHANDVVYNGSAYVQISPVKGLTLRSQLGLFATETRSSSHIDPSVEDLFNTSEASEGVSRSSMWTITNTAEYKTALRDGDIDLTFLLGQEGIKSDASGFSASTDGMGDPRLTMLQHGTTPMLPSDSRSAYQYLSFFGRADLGIEKKYYANFTMRSDASSRFGKSNRTALFFSGGVMWDMMREYWMKPASSWLTALQVKASVGSTGNSEIGNYGHQGLTGTTMYGGEQAFILAQYPNPTLGWEKQIQANFGFTASIMGKFTVDFNVYNRKTKDMLLGIPLPLTTGMSSRSQNIGSMSNRGVEVEFTYDVVRTQDYFFSLRGSYAYNVDKIDELFYDLSEWPMKSTLTNYIVGQGLNFYMPIYAGVDKEDGAPMWYKVGYKGEPGHTFDPETMTKDEKELDALYQDTGKRLYAPHKGGFGLQGGWKGLTLTADFSFVLGKYMVNNSYLWATSPMNAMTGTNQDRDMLSMWKQPGDLADLPGFAYESQFDTHLLENSSYMRLKNLSLSYDFPKRLLAKTKFFEGARLSFTARNVFTITKYKGADPEIASNIAYGNYPATRDFVVGAEISF